MCVLIEPQCGGGYVTGVDIERVGASVNPEALHS